MSDKKSSHIGVGMAIGAAIGVAAATFLQSRQGKVMTKDLSKKIGALQKKVNSELKKAKVMSKESYETLVDKIVTYYVKTQDIAKSEIPAVKKQLMATWKHVEHELKSVK